VINDLEKKKKGEREFKTITKKPPQKQQQEEEVVNTFRVSMCLELF
jgi:hypothetical protein